MNYVEWLRVRNGLRIYAIILGALIVLALIIRISVGGQLGDNEFIVNHIEHDPGTKISHSVVNGLNRTTLVDAAERTTITIDDQNGGGKLIHIVQPASKDESTDHASIAAFSYDRTTKNGMDSITFNTDGPVNFEIFLAFACFAALIFGTIWGCSFACEQGHLEYALLKPITRTRYGLGLIGVDIVGMAIVGAMTIVAAIICMSMFELPHFDFSRVGSALTAMCFVLPIAWYAMLNAATASLRRGYGSVIGFAWPVALLIVAFSHASLSDLPVFRVLHTIFVVASRLIPITYLPGFGLNGNATSDVGLSNPVSLAILVGLMLIYGALALVQWRRVEA
jgi:hypothetical protein